MSPEENTPSTLHQPYLDRVDRARNILTRDAPIHLQPYLKAVDPSLPPELREKFLTQIEDDSLSDNLPATTQTLSLDKQFLQQASKAPQTTTRLAHKFYAQKLAGNRGKNLSPKKKENLWRQSVNQAVAETRDKLPLTDPLFTREKRRQLHQELAPPVDVAETQEGLADSLRQSLNQAAASLNISIEADEVDQTIDRVRTEIARNAHPYPDRTEEEVISRHAQTLLLKPGSNLRIRDVERTVREQVIPQAIDDAVIFKHAQMTLPPEQNKRWATQDPFLATGQKSPLLSYHPGPLGRFTRGLTTAKIGKHEDRLVQQGFNVRSAFGSSSPLTAHLKGYTAQDIEKLIGRLENSPHSFIGRALNTKAPSTTYINRLKQLQTGLESLEQILEKNSNLIHPWEKARRATNKLKRLPKKLDFLGLTDTVPYAVKEFKKRHDKLLHPLRPLYKPFIAIDKFRDKYGPLRVTDHKFRQFKRTIRRKIGNKIIAFAKSKVGNKLLKATLLKIGGAIATSGTGIGTAIFILSLSKDALQFLKKHGKTILKWTVGAAAAVGIALYHWLAGLIAKFGLSLSIGAGTFALTGNPLLALGTMAGTYALQAFLPEVGAAIQGALGSVGSFLSELITSATPAIAQTTLIAGAGSAAAIGGAYMVQENIHKEVYTVPIVTQQAVSITPSEGACWPTSGSISQGTCAEQLCFNEDGVQVTCSHCTYNSNNNAIDIAAPLGTEVQAYHSGRVIRVLSEAGSGGYGNVVYIHNPSEGYTTIYAHLASAIVQSDESVVKGQTIGYVDDTGNSTGNHLHFEVRDRDIREMVPPYQVHGNVVANCRL